MVSKSRTSQPRKIRTDLSVDSDDDDAFFDSEDDDEDQDETKYVKFILCMNKSIFL